MISMLPHNDQKDHSMLQQEMWKKLSKFNPVISSTISTLNSRINFPLGLPLQRQHKGTYDMIVNKNKTINA